MRAPAEYLERDGVGLRRWRTGDADLLYRAVSGSLEHLRPWLSFVSDGFTELDARRFVERKRAEWAEGTVFGYAIVTGADEVVGGCALIARIGPGGLEIGYWLHPGHTGGGLGTRAIRLLTEEAFRVGADRVEIHHDEANERSAGIPRRLGFVEVDRRPNPQSPTPGEVGIDVVWRLCRT
ncbi:MAG TPA: GNAT family N-acetyltransferase [Pseudonocardia sp.]|jgi:RimJ/RimL family protein N-acetyltransferase|nr:GNAT family N-acetyltransferase [Pseudonocardia sp.]